MVLLHLRVYVRAFLCLERFVCIIGAAEVMKEGLLSRDVVGDLLGKY